MLFGGLQRFCPGLFVCPYPPSTHFSLSLNLSVDSSPMDDDQDGKPSDCFTLSASRISQKAVEADQYHALFYWGLKYNSRLIMWSHVAANS